LEAWHKIQIKFVIITATRCRSSFLFYVWELGSVLLPETQF